MTKMLTLLFLLVSSFSFAQMPLNADGKIEYTEVVQVDSATATQLLSNAKMFVANSFKSGKDVTQLVDEPSHTIVAKGWFPTTGRGYLFRAYFQLTIQCKDGRYKYSITNFDHVYDQGGTSEVHLDITGKKPTFWGESKWEDFKKQTDDGAKTTIASLKKQMASSAKSEW